MPLLHMSLFRRTSWKDSHMPVSSSLEDMASCSPNWTTFQGSRPPTRATRCSEGALLTFASPSGPRLCKSSSADRGLV